MGALAQLQGIGPDRLEAFAGWVAAHAHTHLPFVAEIDGYVVGAAWLHIAQRVPRGETLDRRYGDVQSVMVREEYRNQGIGAALMAAILAEARTRGLLHVAVTRLEAAWDGMDPQDQSLILDVLNLVASRHPRAQGPVHRAG